MALISGGVAAPAGATIVATGNFFGVGTPYNGVDDPWTPSSLVVGNMAFGSLSINGGSDVNNTGNALFAGSPAANGSWVKVDGVGTTLTTTVNLAVGNSGAAELEITNGGYVSNGGISSVGNSGNGTATVDGAGSLWESAQQMTVGNSAGGELTVSGGGGVKNTTFVIGNGSTATGKTTVDGGGSYVAATMNVLVGSSGDGTLKLTNGGVVTGAGLSIGSNSTSESDVLIDGNGSKFTSAGTVTVGSSGTGTLDVKNQGVLEGASATIGGMASGVGTATVDGANSSWTNTGQMFVGSAGKGTLNIKNGASVSTGSLEGGNANSSINLDNGNLRVTNSDTASNKVNLLTGGGVINIPNSLNVLSLTTGLSGVGGIEKIGPGGLTLSGASDYVGNTTVTAGTMSLTGAGSISTSPTIFVQSGAVLNVSGVTGGLNHNGANFALAAGQTLKGIGAVSGATTVRAGATLAPGGSIGTLSTGSVVVDPSGTLALELDLGGTPAADLLNVTGAITLTGATLQLSLANVTSGSPQTFLVGANDLSDDITGVFASIVGVPMGYMAVVDYAFLGTDALGRVGTGNDLAITISVAVPEARAWLLVGATAVLGLLGVRWRAARQRDAVG